MTHTARFSGTDVSKSLHVQGIDGPGIDHLCSRLLLQRVISAASRQLRAWLPMPIKRDVRSPLFSPPLFPMGSV